MEHLSRSRPSFRSLAKEQKVALGIVVSLGVVGAVLGGLSFYAYAKRPFEIQLANYAKEGRVYTLSQQEASEREAQKKRDTDADGLTDYDELYVFKTSAYLADTDSDGRDDRTEVFEGTDPNCSDTSGCAVVAELPDETGLAAGDVLPQGTSTIPGFDTLLRLQGEGGVLATEASDGAIPTDVVSFVDSLPIERIREAARASGFPEEKLDAIDDASLRQLFVEAIQQTAAKGELSVEGIEQPTTSPSPSQDSPNF